jgi:TPR repeat protein
MAGVANKLKRSILKMQTQKKVYYWLSSALVLLWAFQLSSCAKVEKLSAKAEDKIAYERGNQAMQAGNLPEAVKHYRVAAEGGHMHAQYSLGLMMANGSGVAKNKVTALKWMSRSAEKGYPPAQQLLGIWYYAGSIAPYNPATAANWFHQAAAQKDANAMYFLGVMYARGEGVGKNSAAALDWFRQASVNGFSVPPEQLTMDGVIALGKGQSPKQASQPGSKHSPATIRNVQEGLTRLGYNPGPVDGLMGKRTASAIQAFQQDVAMPVDGKVSDALMRRIDEALKR